MYITQSVICYLIIHIYTAKHNYYRIDLKNLLQRIKHKQKHCVLVYKILNTIQYKLTNKKDTNNTA